MQDERLLGESNVFGEVLEQVSRLAVIPRPVLVIGERGTGKERPHAFRGTGVPSLVVSGTGIDG